MSVPRTRAAVLLLGVLAGAGLGGASGCASGSGNRAVVRPDLTADDLAPYADLTVYEFLRRHTKVAFVRPQGGGEVMYTYTYGGSLSLTQGGMAPSTLVVDEQEIFDPVEELRRMPVTRVQRLEILKATEYSSRYGGGGRRGAVVITTREEAADGNAP